jgi:hypothetical protein
MVFVLPDAISDVLGESNLGEWYLDLILPLALSDLLQPLFD